MFKLNWFNIGPSDPIMVGLELVWVVDSWLGMVNIWAYVEIICGFGKLIKESLMIWLLSWDLLDLEVSNGIKKDQFDDMVVFVG